MGKYQDESGENFLKKIHFSIASWGRQNQIDVLEKRECDYDAEGASGIDASLDIDTLPLERADDEEKE